MTACDDTKGTTHGLDLMPCLKILPDGSRNGVGIEWIEAVPALMSDPTYALLNAKRVPRMCIDVLVSSELPAQAAVIPEKVDLAGAFARRRMLSVELNARRISTGDASRIERHNRILGLRGRPSC